jgi:glycosyltransferase involved in cell wall biosynthesis
MTTKKNNLSIIIPVFNEANAIAKTLDELIPFSRTQGATIIVVNDGSTDGTSEILEPYKEQVQIITHPYNCGYGAALKTGIRASDSNYIALFDSDGQHRIEDLEMLWTQACNYDMVVGARDAKSNVDILRIPGKWILNAVANLLAGRKIPDLNSGLRIYRRSFITKVLHLMPEGFSFTSTSTIAAFNMGFTVGYFPIQVKKRIGTSSVRQIRDGSLVLMLILRLIILFSPMRIFFPVSAFLAVVGMTYEIYIIITERLKVVNGALLLLLTALIIFFFGLLVDQVSAMRRERFMYDE